MISVKIPTDSDFFIDLLKYGFKYAALNNVCELIETEPHPNSHNCTIDEFWTDDDYNKDVYIPKIKNLPKVKETSFKPRDHKSLLDEVRKIRKSR